jgi:YggT family protein
MIKALIFLINTFSQLYLLLLLMRFWLPVLRANFQNPIAQGVLRYTSPLVVPVRRFVPPIRRLDTATVLVAFVIQFAVLLVISALQNTVRGADPLSSLSGSNVLLQFAVTAFVELAMLSVTLFIVAIGIRVVLNWMGRYMGPISDMLTDLTEPLIRPIRRIIPPLGVLDLSVYVTVILLIALNIMLADLLP